jgi:hypothetical protein
MWSRSFARLIAVLMINAFAVAQGQVNVLTQHNNNQRTGANLSETVLNVSNVKSNRFGFLWQFQVQGQIYAQPLYMEGAPTLMWPKTHTGPPEIVKKPVLYVATMHNLVYAFDAGEVGATPPPPTVPLWIYDAGSGKSDPGVVPVHYLDVYDPASPDTFNMSPVVGIVSTPVIDPELNVMYVVAMTKNLLTKNIEHHLHEIDIATGKANRPPVRIRGAQSFPSPRLQRAGLLLDKRDLYIAFASFGDHEPYNGMVIHFDVSTLVQKNEFVVSPNNGGGGIWQSGGGPAMDEGHFIYFVTGNGHNFNENNGHDFDESDVKLNRQLTGSIHGRVVDYFTPSYQNFLNESDLDLGVSGVMVLPTQPGPAAEQHVPGCPANGAPIRLLAHGSKAGLLYLINRDCMSGFHEDRNNTPAAVLACKGSHIHATPVYWQSPSGPLVYTVCEDETTQGVKAFTIRNGEWVKKPMVQNENVNGHQMSLSASGSTSGTGIIWMLTPEKGTHWSTQIENGALLAFDAETLKLLYFSGDLGKYAKFNAPTIANGHVYAPTFSACDQPKPGPCKLMESEASSFVKVYGLRPDYPD